MTDDPTTVPASLVHDWNGAPGPAPILVDGLLATPRAAGLGPETVRTLVEGLVSVGINHLVVANLPALKGWSRVLPEEVTVIVPEAAGGRLFDGAAVVDAARGRPVEVLVAPDPDRPEAAPARLEAYASAGLSSSLALPDASVRSPGALAAAVRAADRAGARRVVLGDAVVPTDLDLAARTVAAARASEAGVDLDWRGSNRLGVGVSASLGAVDAGARRIHGTFLGVGGPGETTPLDQVLVNLDLSGVPVADLRGLVGAAERIADLLGWSIPVNYPLIGRDAFRTATGVHAAAIIKALAKGESALADRVYSAVPAGRFGKSQVIDVGPMSGMSNVRHWLEAHGIPADEALARAIFERAKAARRTLSAVELESIIRDHRG